GMAALRIGVADLRTWIARRFPTTSSATTTSGSTAFTSAGFVLLRGIGDVAQRLHAGRQGVCDLHVIDDGDGSAGIDLDAAPDQGQGAFGFARTGGTACGVSDIG